MEEKQKKNNAIGKFLLQIAVYIVIFAITALITWGSLNERMSTLRRDVNKNSCDIENLEKENTALKVNIVEVIGNINTNLADIKGRLTAIESAVKK